MIRSVAVDSEVPQRVYAAGPAGLFRSDDGGLTWETAGADLTGEPLAVTLNPAAPKTVFTVLNDGSVWQSDDGATTWQSIRTNE
jgi:photosystem II stability/assembly factor-like uncharacterized protein